MSRKGRRALATAAMLGVLGGGVMLQSLPADRDTGAYATATENRSGDSHLTSSDVEDRDPMSGAPPSQVAVLEVPAVATAAPPPPPAPEPAVAPPPRPAPPSDARSVMLALLNGDRGGGLSLTGPLNALAQYRAQDMIDRDYFSHVPMDGLLAQFGVPWSTWGENIAWRSPSGSMYDFNAMFMASPGHRANIMNYAFRHVGIGIAAGSGKMIVVEVFTD